MTLMDFDGWAFIPGPLRDPPDSSINLHDMVDYPPDLVAGAFLACDGVDLVHPAEPSWWEWRAAWRSGDRYIGLDMTLFDNMEPTSWGGSTITALCRAEDMMGLWIAVRERCPAVWLHSPDCDIFTLETFARESGKGGA